MLFIHCGTVSLDGVMEIMLLDKKTEGELRKEKSIAFLKKKEVPYIEHLPMIEDSASVKIKAPEVIGLGLCGCQNKRKRSTRVPQCGCCGGAAYGFKLADRIRR